MFSLGLFSIQGGQPPWRGAVSEIRPGRSFYALRWQEVRADWHMPFWKAQGWCPWPSPFPVCSFFLWEASDLSSGYLWLQGPVNKPGACSRDSTSDCAFLRLVWLALPLLQSGESETCGLALWGSPSNAGTESTRDFILHSYPLLTEDSLSASQRTLPSSVLCLSYSSHCFLTMVCFSQDKGADLGLGRQMHWQCIAVKITYVDWRRISTHTWHMYVCCWPLINLLLSCLE